MHFLSSQNVVSTSPRVLSGCVENGGTVNIDAGISIALEIKMGSRCRGQGRWEPAMAATLSFSGPFRFDGDSIFEGPGTVSFVGAEAISVKALRVNGARVNGAGSPLHLLIRCPMILDAQPGIFALVIGDTNKPAVVSVRDGRSTVVLRRESMEDLLRLDPGTG